MRSKILIGAFGQKERATYMFGACGIAGLKICIIFRRGPAFTNFMKQQPRPAAGLAASASAERISAMRERPLAPMQINGTNQNIPPSSFSRSSLESL